MCDVNDGVNDVAVIQPKVENISDRRHRGYHILDIHAPRDSKIKQRI
jgi:hypothetical protein